MIDLSGNIKLSFGAKYVAEDTASYILYEFDRSVLDGRAVPFERFCAFLGLDVRCEYLCGDAVQAQGLVAFEPQRLVTASGNLDLPKASAVVERDLIDCGEWKLYNFVLAVMGAQYLFYSVKKGTPSRQLTFDLSSVQSMRNHIIRMEEVCEEIERDAGGVCAFALKLALPKNGFKRQAMELYAMLDVNRATLDEKRHLPFVLETLSEKYAVPEFAVLARMQQLNLLENV
ncbi:MAG: hypothetical protein K2M95_01315 [Clostridiales bacterium]|nr:hypothetical protein [Clostridiales bacterium]